MNFKTSYQLDQTPINKSHQSQKRTHISVKKFGGTSVGTIERIEAAALRVLEDKRKGQSPIVVVSAMAGETNRLVDLGHRLYPHYRGRAYDMLVASGEQVSVALFTMALEKLGQSWGITSKPYLAHQLGIFTDSTFSKARIKKIETQSLLLDVDNDVIPVIAGFQGVDEWQNITTLGRGGSDTTAVAVAAALGACECEIYTDVPAVFSADPRWVPKASEIKKLSFEEMMEMASLGSKVLHIRSVEIGAKFNVKIHVRSSFEFREGTWVVPEEEIVENPVVSAITHDASTAVIEMQPLPMGPAILARIFGELAEKSIVVDIISQGYGEQWQRLAFSIPSEDLVKALDIINNIQENDSQNGSSVELQIPKNCRIHTMEQVSKISIVGVGMRNHPGVAARFFKVLSQLHVPIHLVTTSEIKVSAVIGKENLERVAVALHSEFELDYQETLSE